MNVKLLRKVAKYILEEPKRLLMRTWVVEKREPDHTVWYMTEDEMERKRPFAKCGTAACVSGWACILSGKKEEADNSDYYEVGRLVLGLTENQADLLFTPAQWPKKFKAGYRDDGRKKTAETAAARIEHFIKTKGRK